MRSKKLPVVLAAFVGVLLLIAGTKAYHGWFMPTFHRAEYMHLRLHQDVRDGDSQARVDALLGPGERLDGEQRTSVQNFIRKYPEGNPAGLEDRDTFFGYPVGKKSRVILQYRQDRLVNHNHADFANYDPQEPVALR
jgi:hypothetical protein